MPRSQRWPTTRSTTSREECTTSEICTCSCSAMNAAMARGRNESPMAGALAMCSEPRLRLRMSCAVRAMRSTPSNERWTSWYSVMASAVGCSRPLIRSNKLKPMSSSRLAISRVAAGCEMCSISAARVTVWPRMTARKASS
ncbi:hypothetical protein D3C87_1339110 [compost metagenome]